MLHKFYAFMMKSNYIRKHYTNDGTITNDISDDPEEND